MRNQKSTDEQKIEWLLAHQSLWVQKFCFNDYFEWSKGSEEHKLIIMHMKVDNLISEKTAYYDVNLQPLMLEAVK